MISDKIKRLAFMILAFSLTALPVFAADQSGDAQTDETAAFQKEYTLEQVVVLSRHNIRSPMSTKGSAVCDLTALGVEDYTLPGAIEPRTPIGVKLVFERWGDPEGNDFYQVKLVYQSVDQLRSIQPLSLETPPVIVPISFEETPANEAGMIPAEELLQLFKDKIDFYYALELIYGENMLEDAA